MLIVPQLCTRLTSLGARAGDSPGKIAWWGGFDVEREAVSGHMSGRLVVEHDGPI